MIHRWRQAQPFLRSFSFHLNFNDVEYITHEYADFPPNLSNQQQKNAYFGC